MTIDTRAVVEDETSVGENTNIWHFSHIRSGSRIGSNCNIGHCVYIDEGVVVGNNVKIQNKTSIFNGVTIKDDVFIGPHVCFTNDMFPRATNTSWEIVDTLVEKGASIGANSTIRCGITLGEYSMVAAGSVVTKDVPAFGLIRGNPAKLVGHVCLCGKKIDNNSDIDYQVGNQNCNH